MSSPKPPYPGRPGLLVGLSACFALAGCASVPAGPSTPATQAAEVAASDPDTLLLDAETALQRKQYRVASQLYTRAALLSDDETLIAQAAKVAYDFKQMTDVSRIAAHWLEVNPTSEAGTRYAAFAALDQYRLDEAVTRFDALLNAVYINTAAGFLGLEPQMSANGSATAVTSVLKALVARYPKVAEGHHALAMAALRSENLALALQSAETAHELSPYWSPSGLTLARIQLVVGQTEQGLAKAKAVVDQDGSAGNHLEYALLLLAAEREEEGMSELAGIAASSEEMGAVVERIQALRDVEAGRLESAASRFDRLMQKGAFVFESLFYLGGFAEQRGSWEEARRHYSRVVSGDYAVNAQTRVAVLLAEHATLDAALAWLADFAEQKPQYTLQMIIARSRLLEERGDPDGALQLLNAGLDDYPDSHDLLVARSYLKERQDDVRAAMADLERLHQVRQQDPLVQNALGYLMVDRTRRYKEGFDLIVQAHEQTPDSGPVLDSMGWGLHRLGRNAEALAYLEQARARIYDPEIELHIADVYWALGRRDDALKVWQQGSERHPDVPEFVERLKRNAPR